MRRTLSRGALTLALALAGGDAARAEGEGVAFEAEGLALAAAVEKAGAPNGLVLADLYTRGCTWCKVLDRTTFASPAVAAALAGVVCVRYDADVEPGFSVARRFHASTYPTVLFLDCAGREVDRISGYYGPESFVREVARIRAGDGTLRALRLAHEEDPASAAATVAYARKLVAAGDAAPATALLVPIAEAKPVDPAVRPWALLGLAEASLEALDESAALAWARRLVEEHPQAEAAPKAWLLRIRVHGGRGDVETALAEVAAARPSVRADADVAALERLAFFLHRKRMERSLVAWGERADALGDVDGLLEASRAALEAGTSVGTAVRWAERAVTLGKRSPEALWTWAELLRRTGSAEKALSVAKEAVARAAEGEERERFSARLARWASGPATPAAPPAAPAAPPAPDPDCRPPEGR